MKTAKELELVKRVFDTLELLKRVTDILNQRGDARIKATVEYPGYIQYGDLAFGAINGFWGGDNGNDPEAEFVNVETEVPGTCTDAETIASAILKAVLELKSRTV